MSFQLVRISLIAKLRVGMGRRKVNEINAAGAFEHASGSTTAPVQKR